jgi:phosphonate transport system substrate-binding protein
MLQPYKAKGLLPLTVRALFCLLLLSASKVQAGQHEPQLVMGLLPSLSPIILYKRFEPLRSYLSQQLGYKVVFDTAQDLNSFRRETESDKYDIVLTAPHFVAGALDSGFYHLQVTPSNSLSAVLITRSDSPVQTIPEFNQPVIATPPKDAIITTIGKKSFAAAGLKPAYYEAYGSHSSAYHALLRHKADAAIISINVYHKAIKEKKPLRIIAESNKFPGIGILTSKRLSPELEEKISEALLSLNKTPAGKKILKSISHPGYRIATPDEYMDFKKMMGK